MFRIRRLALAALVAVLPASVALAETRCVSPGVPAFDSWVPVSYQPVLLVDESGARRQGMLITMKSDGKVFAVLMVGGELVAVDPAPEDPAVKVWIDSGRATDDGRLRVSLGRVCQWRQLP